MAKAILIPQCSRPRRTGTYVIEYKGIKALAFVRQESQGLYVHWSVSGTYLSEIGKDAIWWGPIYIQETHKQEDPNAPRLSCGHLRANAEQRFCHTCGAEHHEVPELA